MPARSFFAGNPLSVSVLSLGCLYYQRFLVLISLSLTVSSLLPAQALYRKPVKVLGDPNVIASASNPYAVDGIGPNLVEGRELNLPAGVALDNSVSPPNVYIADSGNNRVLGYRYTTQLNPGSVADVIIGQIDRFGNQSSTSNGRSTGLNSPSGMAVDSSGNLYVADTANNRVLRYANPLAQGGTPTPNMVIGQSSFAGHSANAGGLGASSLSLTNGSTFRSGLAIDSAGNLWVADTGNNRILRFPASALKNGTNNPNADLVLGQPDFVSRTALTVRNSKSTLITPQGLAFDSAGRLLVADGGSRILVYPAGVNSNGLATRLLGIDVTQNSTNTTQTALLNPLGVAANSSGIIVADTANNRLLGYTTADNFAPESTTQFSPAANSLAGQSSYAIGKQNQGSADASASSFNAPVDIALSSTECYVVDAQNHRVLVFPLVPGGLAPAATRVIGQLDFPYFAPNLVEGREFSLAASNTSSVTGSAILDQSVTPPHLYVADTQNNRILGFNDFTHLQNGQKADLVIGQPDFLRTQINYPTNDATQPNSEGLHSPSALAVDSSGNLYVADSGNSRILRFRAPFASGRSALQTADLVIGQNDFRSAVTDASQQNLSVPLGIALTADGANTAVSNSGYLIVSDSGHNRVLFFAKPFGNGMTAAKELGQPNFTSAVGGSDSQHFGTPRGIAVDAQDRLIVADTGNHRVQIFNRASTVNNFDSAVNSITANLSQPVYIAANAAGFWVADGGANQLLHYPNPDQLLIRNNASDATQPANLPLSAFLDNYASLLVADSANRVLYFAPQVNVVSAASGSPRALTAGSIASIYPTVSGNIIAADTANFNSVIPLPASLADTQVLVNGTPAPLFYASPGQINFVLPQSLPTGGTADVQVVRQSTGQIYGDSEIGLAPSDPALFTANSSGAGQAAAINFVDGSINSPLNPVARGQILELFGTGIGPVTNAPPDGQPPTGSVPAPDKPQILIGGATAFLNPSNILYSGLAPTLVGVWQINLTIPADANVGSSIPIKIFEGSIPNFDTATGLGNVTIAIK